MDKLTIRALLIEDNPADELFARDALAQDVLATFAVVSAERLADGLALLDQQPFDVLLLDLGLPDSFGLATFEHAQRHAPDLPVVVLSGMLDEQVAIEAVQAGAQDYLVKGPAGWHALARASRYAIERQQSRAELRASEERFRMALEAAALGTWQHDFATDQISLDARSSQHFGVALSDSFPNLFARLHPDDYARVSQAIGALHDPATSDGTLAIEYRVVHASGEVRWLAVSARIHFAGSGAARRASFVIGTSQDITERKQAEAQIRAHAARLQVLADASRLFAEAGVDYQAVLDQVARETATLLDTACMIQLQLDDLDTLQPVAIYDADPELLAEKRAAYAAVPLSRAEASDMLHVFSTGQAVLVPVVDQAVMRRVTDTARMPLRANYLPHSTLLVPLRAQGQPIGVLALARFRASQPAFTEDDLHLAQDLAERAALAITMARAFEHAQHELAERQRAEAALAEERAQLAARVAERTAELSKANAELARAARLKDEFLANMSHELRTPLNAVLGRAEVLQEGIYGSLVPKQLRAVQAIEESGRHLLALINDILDLSKIDAGKLELELATVDVALLCRMSLRLVAQSALQKSITVSSSINSQVASLRADERRLKQILVNLLANAVKFTPEGGKIGLDVRGDAEAGQVQFVVWDTGIGIAEGDMGRLFRPFSQIDSSLSRQYEGTGLGLALVLRLAQAHQGSVGVESSPGQGSRFSVTLPWLPALPAGAPAGASAPAVPSHAQAADGAQLLLAEDNQDTLDLLHDFLCANGYSVTVARSGDELLARAREQLPALALVDIQMPGMDGLTAIRMLRADPQLRGLPVIAVTALAMPGDRERCLQAGADSYLTKPVNMRALLATIEAQLRQHGKRA